MIRNTCYAYPVSGSYTTEKPLETAEELLEWALVQPAKVLLKCEVQELGKIYTLLEWAVVRESVEDVGRIITRLELLTNEIYTNPGNQTIVYFYLDLVEDGREANLDILVLIAGKYFEFNETELFGIRSPLEYALKKVAFYKNIPWDIIDILLQMRQIQTKYPADGHSFSILQGAFAEKLKEGITSEEEMGFLDALSRYARLERKYGNTHCYLTVEEFNLHTSLLKQDLLALCKNLKKEESTFIRVTLRYKLDLYNTYFGEFVTTAEVKACFDEEEWGLLNETGLVLI